ncbi:ABC transporter ATP-binding protein [Ectobacillus polymachus]|uniref:ABC transporter ATP-binding protein n=1 Tax=Ectobacillus polymachus TaxID=1508806 RepID=UPI003A846045
MDSSIKIDHVSRHFGKKIILENIDMEIERGQIYGLIGPSGAGKTTIVKLIVGMDKANAGEIYVMGNKMPNLKVLQEIGYMAQSDALYATLTAEENLKFFASLFKLNKQEQKSRIAYASGVVNLTNELSKKVSAYSGGMKRRLSLAIALIQDPAILILDEPTVGIDPELRKAIWEELKRLKEEKGKTIIITTHVMDEADKCDNLAMVREGRIITSGSPEELKALYKVNSLEEVFMQAGGVNQ